MSEQWLKSLKTSTPEEGWELAIKLSRMSIKVIQPDEEIRSKLRPVYAEDPDNLIASSQIIAINFQTVAAANKYWD